MNLPKDVVELASSIQVTLLFETPDSSLQYFVIKPSNEGDSDGDLAQDVLAGVRLPKFPLYYVRSTQLDSHGYPNDYVKVMNCYLEEVANGCWSPDTGDDILYKSPEEKVAWLLLGKL